MASRPSYRPGMPKLSRYGISNAPSSLNISAAFFGSRNDVAVNSSSSSFALFMCDPFCDGDVADRVEVRVDPLGHSAIHRLFLLRGPLRAHLAGWSTDGRDESRYGASRQRP